MKPIATLCASHPIPLSLRTIDEEDIEQLRKWKNEHRDFFFYKKVINEGEQKAWYQRWAQEDLDNLFIVESADQKVGCIGVRKFENTADVYNVILGDKRFGGTGLMSEALCATVAFGQMLYPGLPVCVRVLRANPAIGWYERNGFVRTAENDEFVTMVWQRKPSKSYRCNLELSIPITL